MNRYIRHTQLSVFGKKGQLDLEASRVLVIGCGALGSNSANLLVRAGVGHIRLADNDNVEESNLPRQVLFDESDVAKKLPKAEATACKLRQVNSHVEVEPKVVRVNANNLKQLMQDVSVVVDGTDNLDTRYLINETCLDLEIPWIYGGVIGTTGLTMTILPHKGPCLRCLFADPPADNEVLSPEQEGVLNSIPALIGSIQATEAIKVLCGGKASTTLLSVDIWRQTLHQISVVRDKDCPSCGATS